MERNAPFQLAGMASNLQYQAEGPAMARKFKHKYRTMVLKIIKKPTKNNLNGNRIEIGDMPFETAFRKFRKKIDDSGLLRELRDREHYNKPTSVRKQKRAAAVKRWQREQAKHKLPPKLY